MRWQFTIIDYTTNPAGDTTVLPDEPLGWADAKLKIKRGFNVGGDNMHGIFFSYVSGTLEFINEGRDILDAAYQLKGVDAEVELIIEYACSETDAFVEVYVGRFDFKSLDYTKTDYCSITIQVDNSSCLATFQNRYDQKVDLESLVSFDGDALSAYKGIGRMMFLEGKGVQLANDLESPVSIDKTYTVPVGQNTNYFNFIGFNITNKAEAPDVIGIEDELNGASVGPTNFISSRIAPLFEAEKFAAIKCKQVEYDIEVNLQGTFREFSNDGNRNITNWSFALRRVKKNGQTFTDTLQVLTTGSFSAGVAVTGNININFTDTIVVDEGDIIYLYAFHEKTFTTGPGGGFADFDLEYEFTSGYFKMTGISDCEPTETKIFQINEALSRTTEAITNDCLRVYSDYFGRTDAEPYESDSDGCGSGEIITNGLLIRDALRSDGTEPKMFVSVKDLFDGLNAIHNIGFGLEPDPNRSGFQWLRVEPVSYWYSSSIILTCSDVKEIKVTVEPKMIYSNVEIGYRKWESESTNSLDDFLTKRLYRTFLKSITNNFSKLSELIASGYSIEYTRRQKRGDTQDWRYDNDNFIVCTQSEWTGEISFLNPHTIILTGVLIYLEPGDTFTISGSASNDGSYTVDVITNFVYPKSILATPSTTFTVVETVTNESSVNATIGNILKVELGVASGNNVIDPSTIYNARISPVRNLMRWFKSIAPSWSKEFASAVKDLIFTSADGNYLAEMELSDTDCTTEGAIELSESQNINKNDFDTLADATPIWEAETIEFEYPLSRDDFDLLLANPKGVIRATHFSVNYDGYIDEIEYDPNEGMGKFKLIKKYN